MGAETSSTADADRDETFDCFSLPLAVRAAVRAAAGDVDFDDLCSAMGLPFLFTAAPEEPDLSRWLMYGRDAFLIPAGRLFGLAIRELHPPAAARGLDRAAEFRQHFDASYRPLIQRALEHGQAVLAWRGWPAPFDLHWGVITAACDEGVGVRGRVYVSPHTSRDLILESPAVQCYVVESMAPGPPPREEVFKVALRHAHAICRTDLSKTLNFLTGERAFEEWHRIAQSEDQAPEESLRHFDQCVRLALAVRNMLASAIRIIRSHINQYDAAQRKNLELVAVQCRAVGTQMDLLLRAADAIQPEITESPSASIREIYGWIESAATAFACMGRMIELAADSDEARSSC